MSSFQLELRKMMDHLMLGDEEVANWIKKSKTIESIVKLPGDASTRKYYRISSSSKTYIVMRMEPFPQLKESLPFLTVQKHLSEAGIDVPKVLDVDPDRGFMLLEDLGDITLLRKLQDANNFEVERHLYEKVIDSLVQLQFYASPQKAKREIEAFRLRFDFEKLMWEVNFTIENFYQIYLKREFKENDYQVIQEGFSNICTFLEKQPVVLTHRDFHSRNVMCTADRLVMIDFQDARMGPAQYDLASLLRDSYYQLEENQISFLLDYYIAKYEAVTGVALDSVEFKRTFDLMSVQRNFKAIGSFASFLNRRGDAGYLKYIGNTFENIRRTLLKFPEYTKLRETLVHYYYF